MTRTVSEAVRGTVAETGRLRDAVTAGRLSVRGDAASVHRDFRPVVEGFNEVLETLEVRDRFYGALIGRPFGEGLVATAPLPVTATDQLFFKGCP